MMYLKKTAALLLALIMVLSCFAVLSACSEIIPESDSDSKKTEFDRFGDDDDTATEPENETEAETEEVVQYDVNDFVYTYKESSSPYVGKFYCTGESDHSGENVPNRLPLLTIDSDYAREVNAFLIEQYDCDLEYLSDEGQRLDYVAAINGNILSLVVEVHYPANGSYGMNIYNINVETGEEVSIDDVVAMSDITIAQMYELVEEDVEAIFDEMLTQNPQLADSPMFTEIKDKTLADANMQRVRCYFDSDGKLNVVYFRYYLAGPEGNTQFLHLDANFVG